MRIETMKPYIIIFSLFFILSGACTRSNKSIQLPERGICAHRCATKRTITSGLKSHRGDSPFTTKTWAGYDRRRSWLSFPINAEASAETASRLLLRPRNEDAVDDPS